MSNVCLIFMYTRDVKVSFPNNNTQKFTLWIFPLYVIILTSFPETDLYVFSSLTRLLNWHMDPSSSSLIVNSTEPNLTLWARSMAFCLFFLLTKRSVRQTGTEAQRERGGGGCRETQGETHTKRGSDRVCLLLLLLHYIFLSICYDKSLHISRFYTCMILP